MIVAQPLLAFLSFILDLPSLEFEVDTKNQHQSECQNASADPIDPLPFLSRPQATLRRNGHESSHSGERKQEARHSSEDCEAGISSLRKAILFDG